MNNNPKVLIVDDEPETNIKLLRNILENEGFFVLEAHNGKSARTIAKKEVPDLILLDIVMPIENGYITCKKLKEDSDTIDIPVIFISSKSEQDSKLKGFKLGAVDYITKPFDRAEVLARTKIHLQLRSAVKSLLDSQQKRLKTLKDAQKEILVDPLELPEAKFAVFYKTLYEAGGDFYEVLPFSKDIYGYFCADVCGHDLGASLATSSFKALLPQNTGLLYSPDDSLKMINKVLVNVLPEDSFLTAIYAKINRRKGVLTIANAGHPNAIYHSIKGEIKVIDTLGDILGMFDSIKLNSYEFPVNRGDRIYLYTDGLIESDGINTITRKTGLKRLLINVDNTRTMNINTAVESIIESLFSNKDRINDDILLMGIEI